MPRTPGSLSKVKQRELNKLNAKIAFNKIVADIIPVHPKDEYPLARQFKRHFTIHYGTTNTGKTYHALQALMSAKTGAYLAPLRLLALEVYGYLNDAGTPTSLITGEEEIILESASHVSSTIEKLDIGKQYDLIVIDEAQMIADRQRGCAWTRAILGAMGKEIHLCCSPRAVNIVTSLIESCGDTYKLREHLRDTELEFENERFVFPKGVQRGDALIVFSKKKALNVASHLADKGWSVSVIYGNLPPESRRWQVELFVSGKTDVVVSTDAIGMGLNLPIRRIVFLEITKFDGVQRRLLNASEVHQIAGRAGRKNIYDIGLVNSYDNPRYIKQCLDSKLSDITRGYYLPPNEFILSIPRGSLKERLDTCMSLRAKEFKKTDISQTIMLLDALVTKKQLTGEERLKLAFIPFDAKNFSLKSYWEVFVTKYVEKKKFPIPSGKLARTLDEYENYYELLDLYYSFCKVMEISFDSTSVSALKKQTSDIINELLMDELRNMKKKCKYCGKVLPWNFPFNQCERCYHSRWQNYTDG